jgi:predicted solute-binding protein
VISNINYDATLLQSYYTQSISYNLDEAKKNGLAHFLNILKTKSE